MLRVSISLVAVKERGVAQGECQSTFLPRFLVTKHRNAKRKKESKNAFGQLFPAALNRQSQNDLMGPSHSSGHVMYPVLEPA